MESKVLHDYIAGAIGGSAGTMVGYPLDTAKVHLQTRQGIGGYKESWSTLANLYTHGWTHGMFRGMLYPVVSYSVVCSVFFGVYGNVAKVLARWRKTDQTSYGMVFVAGCIAGGAQVIPANPIELVKVILQSQIPNTTHLQLGIQRGRYFKGPTECALFVFRERGIRGLYKGANIMLVRDVPGFGIYCLTYEILRDYLNRISGSALSSFVAGGFAGVAIWFSTMPMDVIKSRVQADTENIYSGILDCVIKTYKSGGVNAFYKGLLITCIRAFPVSAVTFLMYSQCLNYLNIYNPRGA